MSFFTLAFFASCAACSAVRWRYSFACAVSSFEKVASQMRISASLAIFSRFVFRPVSRMNAIFFCGSW